MPSLMVFSGLPGSGKSSIARGAAQKLGAVWVRVDSIEQAIRQSSEIQGEIHDAGYLAAHAVALDNLRLGLDVIADCVNPWMLTRDAWRDVGLRAGGTVIEAEIVCSDMEQHRHRIETRIAEVTGLILPSWQKVMDRDYHLWDRDHLVVDTANKSIEGCVDLIIAALGPALSPGRGQDSRTALPEDAGTLQTIHWAPSHRSR